MRLNEQHIPIGELKAETWLNTCLPDALPPHVSTKGIFYSNYSEDLLEVEAAGDGSRRVTLSRDGLFHLLPEALFVDENRLQDPKKKNKPFKPEKERILNFFVPFDTEYFKTSLELDKTISDIESGMVDLLLETLCGIDMRTVQNPLVRKAAPFLLQAAEIRGDFTLLSRLMTAISRYNTDIQPVMRRVTLSSGRRISRTEIRVVFNIPGLSNAEYNRQYDAMGEFVAFMAEWFFPADMPWQYAIKDKNHPFRLDGSITLDYNTYL